ILRVTDPRFEAFFEFGARVCPQDPVYKTVSVVFKVVPEILKKNPKVKDPYPNLDACSGSLLYHFGMKEFSFYTVMFGVSRTLGMAAQNVLLRGWGEPIESPKSMTTEWFKQQAAKK
ncbi:MAG: citrate (Si)-synthase, partial [Thermoanaerobaculaceae bacterium]|nr:citrate (Si)-synthase [Thermoanaerobaculaceae bacterium]